MKTSWILVYAVLVAGSLRADDGGSSKAQPIFEQTMLQFTKDHNTLRAALGFHKALDADPDFAAAHWNLALLAESAMDWNAAGNELDTILKSKNDSIYQQRAVEEKKRLDEILDDWKDPQKQKKMKYSIYLSQAQQALKDLHYGEATAAAQMAQDNDPMQYNGYVILAQAQAGDEQYDAAKTTLSAAANLVPPAQQATYQDALSEIDGKIKIKGLETQAEQANQAGQHAQAATLYDQAFETAGDAGDGFAAADADVSAGDLSSAETILQKLTAANDLDVSVNAANQLLQVKRLADSSSQNHDRQALMDRIQAQQKINRRLSDQLMGFYHDGLPESVVDIIRDYYCAGEKILSVSFNDDCSKYMVLTDKHFSYSGVPEEMSSPMKTAPGVTFAVINDNGWGYIYGSDGYNVRCASTAFEDYLKQANTNNEQINGLFMSNSCCCILKGTDGYSYAGLPQAFGDAIKTLADAKNTLDLVAASGDGSAWLIAYNDCGYTSNNLPNEMAEALGHINKSQGKISCAALSPDGRSWVLLGHR